MKRKPHADVTSLIDAERPGWQKVADIYGHTIYVYGTPACWEAHTVQQASKTPIATVEPKVSANGTPDGHGFGDNTPREYVTPEGEGSKL